eukprot:scaffold268089_cov45-Prasinocladus_malaysianus.AAC.1
MSTTTSYRVYQQSVLSGHYKPRSERASACGLFQHGGHGVRVFMAQKLALRSEVLSVRQVCAATGRDQDSNPNMPKVLVFGQSLDPEQPFGPKDSPSAPTSIDHEVSNTAAKMRSAQKRSDGPYSGQREGQPQRREPRKDFSEQTNRTARQDKDGVSPSTSEDGVGTALDRFNAAVSRRKADTKNHPLRRNAIAPSRNSVLRNSRKVSNVAAGDDIDALSSSSAAAAASGDAVSSELDAALSRFRSATKRKSKRPTALESDEQDTDDR